MSSLPLNNVGNVKIDNDTTSFDWTVGRFKGVRFGDAVTMSKEVCTPLIREREWEREGDAGARVGEGGREEGLAG